MIQYDSRDPIVAASIGWQNRDKIISDDGLYISSARLAYSTRSSTEPVEGVFPNTLNVSTKKDPTPNGTLAHLCCRAQWLLR